jgi:hypothetical protein
MSKLQINNDGTIRTRTQLARDVYKAANDVAMKVYKAVIAEEFPPGTKVRWDLRIGKPKMDGVVTQVFGWEWSDEVEVRARTGTSYSLPAWRLEKVTDAAPSGSQEKHNG